ncbi:prefoldin subunit beta [Candidatus Woesearchaeota archaeon]|nr:prefoldin subunit beta [Candidatus Woesearchaeota archaeon]
MNTDKKINQLQQLEQNISNISFQKQNFQSQLTEVESAINELEHSNSNVYKIIGQIMVNAEKDALKQELNEKKEIINLRIKTLEKQEDQIKEKARILQEDVIKEI